MHSTKLVRKSRSIVGHPSIFPDGTYFCKGTFGMDRVRAEQAAESMAKRYKSKTLVTEKKVRVGGEHGTVIKPIYLIWERRK